MGKGFGPRRTLLLGGLGLRLNLAQGGEEGVESVQNLACVICEHSLTTILLYRTLLLLSKMSVEACLRSPFFVH